MGQKKKSGPTIHPIPSVNMKVARRPGNPEVLVKRQLTDIPVSIYFFRTPAFFMYFCDGPFHATSQRNF